jgi:hypothetical protein
VNGFAYTHDPRREVFRDRPMILYRPFQEEGLLEIIRAINNEDLFIEKSRDMGASWLCLLAFEWAWHFHSSMSFLLGSRVEDYVDKSDNPKALFWKIDFLHRHLPSWLMPPGYDDSCRSRLHMLNPFNGSVIDGESTTKNFARGDRRSGILCDEFAMVEQGHGIISSVADATDCCIYNSTPQGVGNAHDSLRHTAIKKLRFHWSEHPEKSHGMYTTDEEGNLKVLKPDGYPDDYKPILDGKLRSPAYDYQESRLGPRKMAQEWDIDYLGSGYQFFRAAAVQEAIHRFARAPILVGDLEYDDLTAGPIRFREDPCGRLQLWCQLDKEGNILCDHSIVVGSDVSAGTGASNSCLCAYDVVTNEKLLEYANPYIRPEQFAKQAVAICRWLRKALLIWESNGPGRQFGSRVVELGYGYIYCRRQEEAISKKVKGDIPGWASTQQGKLVLMGEYRAAVENFKVVNRSKIALEVTLEYIFDGKGGVEHSRANSNDDPTGARSNHGDRVMADALAWHSMSTRRSVPPPKKPEAPVGSLAWRMKMREAMKPKPGRELLVCEGWG